MKFSLLFTVLFCLSACVSSRVNISDKQLLFFSDGQYQQEIHVEILAAQPKQVFDFNCLIVKNNNLMKLLGVNNFGITLFKIEESSNKDLIMDSSIDQITEHKDFLIKIFKLVKTIMSLEKKDPKIIRNEIKLQLEGLEANVKFASFDPSGVPSLMTVGVPNQYLVNIMTTSYKIFSN